MMTMQVPAALQSFLEPWLFFLADDPLLRILQAAMILAGVIVVFLVFYTTRDILLRTQSFWYMFVSILLVSFLPIAGFFLYLLIRPARTLKEREMDAMVREVWADHMKGKAKARKAGKDVEESKGGD